MMKRPKLFLLVAASLADSVSGATNGQSLLRGASCSAPTPVAVPWGSHGTLCCDDPAHPSLCMASHPVTCEEWKANDELFMREMARILVTDDKTTTKIFFATDGSTSNDLWTLDEWNRAQSCRDDEQGTGEDNHQDDEDLVSQSTMDTTEERKLFSLFGGGPSGAKARVGKMCFNNKMCETGICAAGMCSECKRIDSQEGCPDDKFCSLSGIALKCVPKRKAGKMCLKPVACKSGSCSSGFCNECKKEGSIQGCPKDKVCSKKTGMPGLRCTPKLGPNDLCKDDWQCRSGFCNGLACGECRELDSTEGCPQDKVCGHDSSKLGLVCLPTRDIGGACKSDEACSSSRCVDGICSECNAIEIAEGCPEDKVCLDLSEENMLGLRCAPKKGDGVCSRGTTCKSGICNGGFCSECARLDRTEGCPQDQICTQVGIKLQCRQKRDVGEFCRSDLVCAKGHCVSGFCSECSANGPTEECPEDHFCFQDNVEPGLRCSPKRDAGSDCRNDYFCKSNMCQGRGRNKVCVDEKGTMTSEPTAPPEKPSSPGGGPKKPPGRPSSPGIGHDCSDCYEEGFADGYEEGVEDATGDEPETRDSPTAPEDAESYYYYDDGTGDDAQGDDTYYDDYYSTPGDDYYATGDDYYATGDDYYATPTGDDYYATPTGDDYYATPTGDDHYATPTEDDGGDTYYYPPNYDVRGRGVGGGVGRGGGPIAGRGYGYGGNPGIGGRGRDIGGGRAYGGFGY